MGAYISYDPARIIQLEKKIAILERRIYVSEQNSMQVNDHLIDLERRVDSAEKTADYINTSITYMQHSIDELASETFSK